jgi:hypothetical protein
MRGVCLCLGLLLAGGLGCSSRSAPAPAGATTSSPDGWRSELLFSDSEEGLQSGQFSTKLNFAPIRDLWFRAKVPAMPHVAMMTIQFISPQGQSFYADSFPFSPDPAMSQMMMPSSDHPVTVLQAKAIPGGFQLDHHVQIAGSVFHRYPLAGKWKVLATVEGYTGVLASTIDVEYTR